MKTLIVLGIVVYLLIGAWVSGSVEGYLKRPNDGVLALFSLMFWPIALLILWVVRPIFLWGRQLGKNAREKDEKR